MGAVNIRNDTEVSGEARNDGDIKVVHSSLTVDHSLTIPEITPRIVELFKDLFKHWSNLDESRFVAENLSGGITNRLLKVAVEEENGTMVHVTVRIDGPNTEYIINRDRELQAIHHLSAAGFGPKLLGTFENGMVQSFIHARTLDASDMREPKLAAEIAKQLKSFHQVDVPGSKEPQLWNDISKFFKKASHLTFDDCKKQNKYKEISFKEVETEIIKLKELAGHLNAPVVFAHNDLLSGNLMLNDDEEKLYFIDFEYGSYSYRGFDIGNHFNEYAGLDCDYTLYPSKNEQYHFFRHYLNPEKPNEVSDKDLEALYVESTCYMLVSHLYWALWALIQAKMSPNEFDYLEYFFLRYDEYKRQKNECFSLAKSYLSQPKTI
ncbi:hypothetical protein QVD17_27647 [Tagetes erecta]|uniref:ethanolamine kinase n=1 Tax=Tagetes erecta TaxID=13708 RepID=A0AAD8NRK6_TARER|nr:hypothetical protein QVD17_27647 [Tagetes erecta]